MPATERAEDVNELDRKEHDIDCIQALERMAGYSFSGASVREALRVFERLFWRRNNRPLTAPEEPNGVAYHPADRVP